MSSPQPQDIEQAFLFHFLATEPQRVLPKGKSLLSVISQRPSVSNQIKAQSNGIETQVERALRRAFWDEAKETLSSPQPSIQLPRLRLLYSDLLPSLRPLFPKNHRIIAELSAPVPPTSSPLHSAVAFLDDILRSLRKRCAPVRDPDIDTLLEPLQFVPPVSTLHNREVRNTSLANLVIDTIQSIMTLAPTLKEDLSHAVLAGMTDSQLSEFAKQQACLKEREVILKWDSWINDTGDSPKSEETHALQDQWSKWVNTGTSHGKNSSRERVIQKLISALSSSSPVSCMPRDPNPNPLPPQFFFLRPALFRIQNQLQALVIAASLLTLLKSSVGTKQTVVPDFVTRIWSLLEPEIDQDNASRHPEEPDTKLVNLADEMIRAQRMVSGSTTESEEKQIRASVERTLQLEDPVFRLLQTRLIAILEERLLATQQQNGWEGEERGTLNIPKVMRTGRHLSTTPSPLPLKPESRSPPNQIVVKGYDDDLLRENITDVFNRITRCIEWLRYTWSDTILI